MRDMNLLRLRLNHSDILTFMMCHRFIIVKVRSIWYRHRRLSTINLLSCNGPRSCTGPTDS